MTAPPNALPPERRALLERAGYMPSARDLPALVAALDGDDEALADASARALLRLGDRAGHEALVDLDHRPPSGRARRLRLVGRVARASRDDVFFNALVAGLEDDDPRARRAAASALGKLGDRRAEAPLVALWDRDDAPTQRRVIAEALGKVGGTAAAARLADAARQDTAPAPLAAAVEKANLVLGRSTDREAGARVEPARSFGAPLPVVLYCRAGLEPLLVDELGPASSPREVAPGTVRATLEGPLATIFRCRTALSFGFPVGPVACPDEASLGDALGRLLASPEVNAIVTAFTEGAPTVRLAFGDGGHRRSVVWAAAARLAKQGGVLRNDPTRSTWDAHATLHAGKLYVTLRPHAIDDPRFSYRVGDVPASSHPTVAAALAWAGGVRSGDVVYDPFVGSGLEIIERARLGPATFFATDTDPRALEVASRNLASAGVRATLTRADALSYRPPEPVTLVLTNPPFGRRVGRRDELGAFFTTFLRHASGYLAPGGRLVWLSPLAEHTAAAARASALRVVLRRSVDLGGVAAELQVIEKPAGGGRFSREPTPHADAAPSRAKRPGRR